MGYLPLAPQDIEDDAPEGEVPAARERIERLIEIRGEMAARWEAAKEAQTTYYNARHKPQEFSIGQLVLLSARNIRTRRPNKKLDHRWLGPFEVEAIIGKQAYRLKLPTSYKAIHPVFHVFCLEPYQGSARAPQGQPAQLVEGEEEWVVEKILAERGSGRDKQYLV